MSHTHLVNMQSLAQHLDAYISGNPIPSNIPDIIHHPDEQRVTPIVQSIHQRLIAPLQRETNAAPTTVANAPVGRRALQITKLTHQ